ncbi:MAG: ester cyclase [Paracoccaceae bacterium]|nr:ester cyclase [Paracoccaceae bacterium]
MNWNSRDRGNRKSHHPAQPLARSHMPGTFAISLRQYTGDRSVRIPADRGPSQSLRGFDPDYRNIVDYIVRITYRIWETENRDVEYIGECYAPDSIVYDDYGLQSGSRKIIDDTFHTTGAFPDIILDAEDVIWGGDDQIGFHTSHLTRIIGTNTRPSRYGASTGRRVHVPVIANCVALENDIFLEHVLYNTSAMLRQLGIELWPEAERLAADPPHGWPRSDTVWRDLRKAASPDRPISVTDPVAGFDPDQFSRRVHHSIWNGDVGALDWAYVPDFEFEGTTGRTFAGRRPYRSYVAEIRECFPDLDLQVDEVYWMGNDSDGWLISTRWSAEGTHESGGHFGDATGTECQIWGITQCQVKNGRIRKEWQLFNEFDLMMQISRDRHG